MELKNKKLSEEAFLAEREQVLQEWPTGSDSGLDLTKAIEYLKQVPESKNFALKLIKAKQSKVTMIQPRAGVPVLDEHIKLLQYLEKCGADFLPSTIDSYTRQNRYLEAEKGIKESELLGRALLNGFPVVNHGVPGCKKVLESVNVPLQARHGTPDARLLSEIIQPQGGHPMKAEEYHTTYLTQNQFHLKSASGIGNIAIDLLAITKSMGFR